MHDETPASEINEVEMTGGPTPPQPGVPQAAPPQPQGPLGAASPAAAAPPPPPPPAPEGALPPPPAPAQVTKAAEPKVMPPEWPHAGYTGPQPWEAENPPALTQNHLMVSSGSAGEVVVELAALLAHLGYGTTISAGQNPHAIYDTGVSDAVRSFCADYGVTEDPQVRSARTEDTVGPWIWEALVRAVHKQLAGQQEA
jgi:hypothetical protein